jgi:hypothetical protein
MLFPDIPVWYAFLNTYGRFFKALYYDCFVGGPTLTEEQEKDPLERMWRANTVKRIDALAELENEIWIIEVATYPGPRSLGQLISGPAIPGTAHDISSPVAGGPQNHEAGKNVPGVRRDRHRHRPFRG